MNEEEPEAPKVDGRPVDDGLGPTAQAAEGVPIGRPQVTPLGATACPSRAYRAERERGGRAWPSRPFFALKRRRPLAIGSSRRLPG